MLNPSYIDLSLTLCFSLLLIHGAAAQPSTTDPPDVAVSFRPSVAIVIGVFSVMFSLTFVLLLCAKFCHSASTELFGADWAGVPDSGHLIPPPAVHGLDKAVIESLPLFRFSSLKGARGGLECAVCLSRFEDAELLRLLPACKHAFHLACVDRWLEANSSCPLCRREVGAADAAFFKYSASSRHLLPDWRDVDAAPAAGAGEVDLFVEREPGSSGRHGGSLRFSIGGSFRKLEKITKEMIKGKKKDQGPLMSEDARYHKFKHRIVASDVVFKSRWSDLNSADLMSLNSEMLSLSTSSKRFNLGLDSMEEVVGLGRNGGIGDPEGRERVLKIKDEMEKKRVLESKATAAGLSSGSGGAPGSSATGASISPCAIDNRSMSEITNVSRFQVMRESSDGPKDERIRRVWLPIARRTVEWSAGREGRRSQYDGDVAIV